MKKTKALVRVFKRLVGSWVLDKDLFAVHEISVCSVYWYQKEKSVNIAHNKIFQKRY